MSLVISWSGGFLYESESSGLENHLFSMYLAVKKTFFLKIRFENGGRCAGLSVIPGFDPEEASGNCSLAIQ